jgi:uncharacterized membrane protein YjfL (UPF0719 family)
LENKLLTINFTLLQTFFIDFIFQFGAVVSLLFLSSKIRRFVIDYKQHREKYQTNRAIAISSGGYYLSVMIVLFASVSGESYGFEFDLISIFVVGIFGILLLSLNRLAINYIYLKELNREYEFERENIAFSLFQVGGFLATAIIIYHSFAGFELTLGLLFIATIYFIISQIILFSIVKIFILHTEYDDINEIKRGNVAVGVEFLSIFIVVALLLGNIVGEVLDINLESIASILFYFSLSIIFLIYIPDLITTTLLDSGKKVNALLVAIKSGVVKLLIALLVIETLPLDIISFG